jgi:hypothetical protein
MAFTQCQANVGGKIPVTGGYIVCLGLEKKLSSFADLALAEFVYPNK